MKHKLLSTEYSRCVIPSECSRAEESLKFNNHLMLRDPSAPRRMHSSSVGMTERADGLSKANKKQSGYIALMSAIIISALLLLLAVTVSLTGFLSRSNELDAEYKQRSLNLAQGCAQVALLHLAQDPTNTTVSDVNIGDDKCSIISIQPNTPASGQTTIQTKAEFQTAVTNLRFIINSSNLSIISLQELPAS